MRGAGLSVAEARRELMAAALEKLSDRHLQRLQRALAPELEAEEV